MIVAVAALLTVGAVAFTLFVRPKDIHLEPPAAPTRHLEQRKAQIYEALRDLQFEFRLGKLSEADYQKSKFDLQKELARVMAQIDDATGGAQPAAAIAPATAAKPEAKAKPATFACSHCGAEFDSAMKFCGECGKPMTGGSA